MSQDHFIQIIYEECMLPYGFVTGIRENRVNDKQYQRLLQAIQTLAVHIESSYQIDRLVVACLFEVPWEIENTIPHYKAQNPQLAEKVSKMAGELREAINNLLWSGLEKYYENIE